MQRPAPGDAETPATRIQSTDTTLGRFQEARFGLFVHWGLYSLAGGQWRGAWSATEAPWSGKPFTEFLQLQARIPIAEFEAFARQFQPHAFDAEAWVAFARAAGMRYLVITTKHHEGFAMFRSASNPFNIADHAGFGRDPLAKLADACRRGGLLFGVYYSLGRDWHDPDAPTDWPTRGGRSNTWDYPDEDAKVFDRYFRRKVLPQVRELLTGYGAIDLLWFDTPEGITPAQSLELRELIRELQPDCLVNDRVGNNLGDFGTFEQRIPEVVVQAPWEACATLGAYWGYHARDLAWKSPEVIVRLLVDVVAKGGNFLLNVGPRGDGTFPPGAAEHLAPVGRWLAINGEAIHGARPWHVFGEGASESALPVSPTGAASDTVHNALSETLSPDLRFTVGKDGAVYVLARSWRGSQLIVRSFANIPLRSVSLLGSQAPVGWNQSAAGLELPVPSLSAGGIPVWVYRVDLAGSERLEA